MAKDDIAVVGARVSNFSNVAPKAQTDQYSSLKQVVDNRGGIVHFFITSISSLINGRGSSEIKNQTWFASFKRPSNGITNFLAIDFLKFLQN